MTIVSIEGVPVNPTTNKSVVVSNCKLPVVVINNLALLLKCVLYIHYPIHFKKDQARVQALINSGSEINAIISMYIAKLSFKVRLTNVKA